MSEYPVSLVVTCNHHLEPSALVDFINQNNCYKLVAILIIHDPGLTPIPYIDWKSLRVRGPNRRHTLLYEFKAVRHQSRYQ